MLILSISTIYGNTCNNTYKDIVPIVEAQGFKVTATTNGRHNKGSKHYLGKAVDVSVRGKTEDDIQKFMHEMYKFGYEVSDERTRPKGQRTWHGSHLHVNTATYCFMLMDYNSSETCFLCA